MRQWHLLAMAEACEREKTLTNIGRLMGCSRQNVRRLADALERRGFVRTAAGPNNAVLLETTERRSGISPPWGRRTPPFSHACFPALRRRKRICFSPCSINCWTGWRQVEQLAESAPAESEV